jgi:hypothetical protein
VSPAAADKSLWTKYRPYLLGAVFGLMALYFGGEWVVDKVVRGPLDKARQTTEALEKEIKKETGKLARAQQEVDDLNRWRRESLPSDPEAARSLYQAWLLELVEHVKLAGPAVTPGEPSNRRNLYYTIPFAVRGQGNLKQLTEFLFVFYKTDLLHQIRSLNITPVGTAGQLDLSIAIEAAVLPGAGPETAQGATAAQRQATIYEDFRDRTHQESVRLASVTLAKTADDYRAPGLADYQPIVRRNLFGIGDTTDPTDYAYLTTINAVDGEPEVWFTLRATDEILKLRKGDRLEVGDFVGTIAEIEGSEVVIESEGERWLLTLGDRLTDAYALPPEL